MKKSEDYPRIFHSQYFIQTLEYCLISACYKSQEGDRFTPTASCALRILFVIFDDLMKGHRWINCVHTIHLLFCLNTHLFSTFTDLCYTSTLSEVFSAYTVRITLFLVKINKKCVVFLCDMYIVFVKFFLFHFVTLKWLRELCLYLTPLFQNVWEELLEHFRPTENSHSSSANSLTDFSSVAQLVANRTTVWVSSFFSQKEKFTCLLSSSIFVFSNTIKI